MIRRIAGGLCFLGTAALFLLVVSFKRYNIPTVSMEPTVEIGDQVIMGRFADDVMRGDLVVYRNPSTPQYTLMKRVVGLPCDRLDIREKELYVNGVRAVEPYARYDRAPALSGQSGIFTVPPGHYFVLGDNRNNSNDSRFSGPVPAANIRGRVVFVIGRHHFGRPHRPPVLASLPACRSITSAPLATPATTPAR